MASDRTVTGRVDDRLEDAELERVDVAEHGRSAEGEATPLDRRLYMQLHAYGGSRDSARSSRRSSKAASTACSTRT